MKTAETNVVVLTFSSSLGDLPVISLEHQDSSSNLALRRHDFTKNHISFAKSSGLEMQTQMQLQALQQKQEQFQFLQQKQHQLETLHVQQQITPIIKYNRDPQVSVKSYGIRL